VSDVTPRTEGEPANEVELGVVEFHSESLNPGLVDRFHYVIDDLSDSSSIVDVWLMDIASVLAEFDYEMKVYRGPDAQKRWEANR
jgi:hypothetical protein